MRRLGFILGVVLTMSSLSYTKEAPEKLIILEENLLGYTPIYNIYTKAGLDIKSEYEEWMLDEIKINKKETHRLGFEVGFEATRNIDHNFELGIGGAYQNHTKFKAKIYTDETYDMPKFDSIPLYAVAKYKFETETIWKPYLKCTLGYSFNFKDKDTENKSLYIDESNIFENLIKFDTDLSDDLYYGFGAGVEYNSFFADLMYKVNEAKANLEEDKEILGKKDFDYSRITLGFGYKFSF
ncbi:MAG: outer membrane beta-barrel protein [Cetobacterium sp.]|uniref:outer membrane beta-barrel protein n=1 Tax=unclassified Cetobacterium TaxID=2630983 RepID=UPI00068F1643|nr:MULTISPECIES: outer membrane beta-barrel protein [unclassified Cetobacterium]